MKIQFIADTHKKSMSKDMNAILLNCMSFLIVLTLTFGAVQPYVNAAKCIDVITLNMSLRQKLFFTSAEQKTVPSASL